MADTPWTPGPWAVEQETVWPFRININPEIVSINRVAYSTSQKTLDDVRSGKTFDHDERDGVARVVAEQEANARLIAAAPDLEASNRALLRFIASIMEDASRMADVAAVQQARAALRAAGHPDYQEKSDG